MRRSGRLAFAETIRLDGDIAETLSQPAVANGGVAIGTVLIVPGDERESGYTRYELDQVSLAEAVDDARALSLFASRRVIWLANAEAALPRHLERHLAIHQREVLLRLAAVEKPIAQVRAARTLEHHADEQRLELHGDLGERGRVLAMRAPP